MGPSTVLVVLVSSILGTIFALISISSSGWIWFSVTTKSPDHFVIAFNTLSIFSDAVVTLDELLDLYDPNTYLHYIGIFYNPYGRNETAKVFSVFGLLSGMLGLIITLSQNHVKIQKNRDRIGGNNAANNSENSRARGCLDMCRRVAHASSYFLAALSLIIVFSVMTDMILTVQGIVLSSQFREAITNRGNNLRTVNTNTGMRMGSPKTDLVANITRHMLFNLVDSWNIQLGYCLPLAIMAATCFTVCFVVCAADCCTFRYSCC